MGGTYKRCIGDNGKFSMDLIENMRDAHEALEQMFFMIGWLADQLSADKIVTPKQWINASFEANLQKKREISKC